MGEKYEILLSNRAPIELGNDTAHINSHELFGQRTSTRKARVSFRECLPKPGWTGQDRTIPALALFAKFEVFSTGFISVFFSSLRCNFVFLASPLTKYCVASVNPEFGATMARRLNQIRVSAVQQSNHPRRPRGS